MFLQGTPGPFTCQGFREHAGAGERLPTAQKGLAVPLLCKPGWVAVGLLQTDRNPGAQRPGGST